MQILSGSFDRATWVCWILNLLLWALALGAYRSTGLPLGAAWAIVGIRIVAECGVFGGYRGVPESLDRAAWLAALGIPLVWGSWASAVLAFCVAVAWYLASNVVGNLYVRARLGTTSPN
jgi:hypothetical protein